MKTHCYIFLCFLTIVLTPVGAAENQGNAGNVDQQVREIDLKLALRQYEQIQTQILDIQLNLALLTNDSEISAEDRKKQSARMEKKEEVLTQQLQQTLVRIRPLGEQMKQSK